MDPFKVYHFEKKLWFHEPSIMQIYANKIFIVLKSLDCVFARKS